MSQTETITILLPKMRVSSESGGGTPASEPRSWWHRLRPWSPLLILLAIQAGIALTLDNTAFVDEACYLVAGHRELEWWIHSAPLNDDYAKYFSGSPFLYPVLGALTNALGGLAAARLLGTACMLGATCLLYTTTRLLFDRTTAIFGAALFALCGPVLFMSHFATFDAPAVCLLAASFMYAVRSANSRVYMLETAVFAVLAVSFKYASLAYLPSIVAVATIVAIPRVGWRWAAVRGVVLGVLVGTFAVVVLIMLGHDTLTGILTTTLTRANDVVTARTVLDRSATYAGIGFLLALLGTVWWLIERGDGTGPGRKVRGALGLVLTCSALIAPLGDVRLHTLTSLEKHAGYGLLFAAPMGGLLLARVARRLAWAPSIAAVLVFGAFGANQAHEFFAEWPDSTTAVTALQKQITNQNEHILAEEPWIWRYYLGSATTQFQWNDTYYFSFKSSTGQQLTGLPAYQAALTEHYFDVVILDQNATPTLDAQLASAMETSGYEKAETVKSHDRFGPSNFVIWTLIKTR